MQNAEMPLDLNCFRGEVLLEGKDFLDLSMINPDLAPSRLLLDKLSEANAKAASHRYAVSRGIAKLRSAFSIKYNQAFGVSLDAEREICVTLGTKDAFNFTLRCVAEVFQLPRRSVLVGKPTYPPHLFAANFQGFESDFFEIKSDQQAMLNEIEHKAKSCPFGILILNFPNNPSGISVDVNFYRALYDLATRYNFFVINDFVYGEMGFRSEPVVSLLSVANFRERACETYSLSKAYNVPGWRVAALMGQAQVINKLSKLKANLDYGLFLAIQQAAAFALTCKEDLVRNSVLNYNRRCQVFTQGLEKQGWQVQFPNAGVCVWARMGPELSAKLKDSSKSYAYSKLLLSSKRVLGVPGLNYGPEFDAYMRFAMVLSEDKLRVCLQRMEELQRESL